MYHPNSSVNDQNIFTSNLQSFHETNDSSSRSPLVFKGSKDYRFSHTETKTLPFKNSTNDRNILPSCSASHKKSTHKASAFKDIRVQAVGATADIRMRDSQKSDSHSASFYGDRFIPCRMSNNTYEMQYSHEEMVMTQRQSQINNHSRTDSNTNSQDSQLLNQQQTNGVQTQQIGSQGLLSSSDQNQQMYSNLLQSQCLGQSFYGNENFYENLSHYDFQSNNSQQSALNPENSNNGGPVGLFSNLSSGPVVNQSQTHALQAKARKSIFKYKANYFQQSISENAPYNVSPLLNIDTNEYSSPSVKSCRKIPKMPFKVLDAPQLQDDFYLNLVDWSSSNILAVGLGRAVYIWSACTSRVTKLCEVPPDDSITSVAWNQRGSHLAVGTNSGDTQIWDTTHCKLLRTLTGHLSRVGTVAWNGSIVSTGSRDRNILQRDLRASNSVVQKLVGHKQEVCGLKWSFDDTQLASGGNDNKLMIWSLQSEAPMVKFSDHTAAVKAIGWSPHQNGLLASGGGTADRCIRFWNTNTLQPINFIDTGSQVCNLMFSKNVNEIVSTHGYSLNQIIVWKYPTMQKVTTLTGHTYRVLYLSMSPDGQNIVTGAGDETLRFWSVFPSVKGKQDNLAFGGSSSLYPSSMDIR